MQGSGEDVHLTLRIRPTACVCLQPQGPCLPLVEGTLCIGMSVPLEPSRVGYVVGAQHSPPLPQRCLLVLQEDGAWLRHRGESCGQHVGPVGLLSGCAVLHLSFWTLIMRRRSTSSTSGNSTCSHGLSPNVPARNPKIHNHV